MDFNEMMHYKVVVTDDAKADFGTFEVAKRAARTGKNPQTGAAIKIPASKAPKFKAGKALKDLVNKK